MDQRPNKAHTATVNRIAQRYGARPASADGFDIQNGEITVEVETTATLSHGLDKLLQQPGRVYLAVTNKEALEIALRVAAGTRVGVMDPQGNVVRPSESPGETTPVQAIHRGD